MARKGWGSGDDDRRELRVGRQRERGDGGARAGKVARIGMGSRWERKRRQKRKKRLVGWTFRHRRT